MAQPGSAHAWGAWGRRFKSARPDQIRLCDIFKNYLDIRVQKPQKSILMLASGISGGLKALCILEEDYNNKSYNLGLHLESYINPMRCFISNGVNEALRKIYQFGSIGEVLRLF